MPYRTVYSLTDGGKVALKDTLGKSVLQFGFDTNVFTIAAFFLHIFPPEELQQLLQERLSVLQKYHWGIENQITPLWESQVPARHAANVKRMAPAALFPACQRLLSCLPRLPPLWNRRYSHRSR